MFNNSLPSSAMEKMALSLEFKPQSHRDRQTDRQTYQKCRKCDIFYPQKIYLLVAFCFELVFLFVRGRWSLLTEKGHKK
jgi:hypothetical protein